MLEQFMWLIDPVGAATDAISQKILLYAKQLQCDSSKIKATIFSIDNEGKFRFSLYNEQAYVGDISGADLLDNPDLSDTVNRNVSEKILQYAKKIPCEPVNVRATIYCVDKPGDNKGKFRFCLQNLNAHVRDIKIKELIP